MSSSGSDSSKSSAAKAVSAPAKRVSVRTFAEAKATGGRISMITAYDYNSARLCDEAGIDSILIGDSLGMVMLGYDSTLPVTMDDMVSHTAAVTRATSCAFVVADMPFMSYQITYEEALRNAGRLIVEGGATAVKIEGASESTCKAIRGMVEAGIPVMGHIGLTPQSVNAFGGFVMQGKTPEGARQVLADCLAVAEAGAFAVVLECIPENLAESVTQQLPIPTIGIGAGPHCDGQVQVFHDVLGLAAFTPKHAKRYSETGALIRESISAYVDEVHAGTFDAAAASVTSVKATGEPNSSGRAIERFTTKAEVRTFSKACRAEGKTVALVPTMGALHAGHVSLVEEAKKHADVVIVSVFVNPTQFAPGEDFETYPRNVDSDAALLATHGVAAVFAPTTEEMYGASVRAAAPSAGDTQACALLEPQTRVVPGELATLWEGASRPIHFAGVTTVVAKLINIIAPDMICFGEKDFQQLAIVRRMVADLDMDVEVVGCPIIRDADGLARSSRNVYLSAEERTKALAFSKALVRARELVLAGERDCSVLENAMRSILENSGVSVEYACIIDADTLKSTEDITASNRALLAGKVGSVRLIDNASLSV